MRSLPPLTALRAAEAASRTGSIASAARELGVSAPAVSQQIRLLEDHLGRRLFDRGRKGVSLTDAGRAVLPYLREGFDSLARISEIGSVTRAPGRLTVSAIGSVAMKWLPAVLAEAVGAISDLRVDLRMAEDPITFGEDGPDLHIGFGDLPYAGIVQVPLAREFLLPVCAPTLDADRDPDRFIHTDWGSAYASPPVWRDWARLAGNNAPDPRRGLRAGASALALNLALEGAGVALGQALLCRRDLEAGRLAVPFGPPIPMPSAYVVCHRARPGRPELTALVDYLVATAEADIAAARRFSPLSA